MPAFGGNRSIAIGLSVNPAGVKAGLAVARKELTDFARAGAQASQKHRRSYDDIAGGLAKAGLAIGAFAAVSVVAAAKFDKSMSRASAATQATTSELSELRAAALKAGAQTQFSATQAADAITEMGKAGVSVQDILGGGLTGTLNLAAAGELEVARAAEIGATAMTQFALKGSDLGHVADVLAAGAGKAQGSVEDLAQGLKFVGPVANNMGVSLEQTTGVLALFAKQGIIGEQAGTSLRGMLLTLAKPSKEAARLMQDLGIQLYDAQGNFIGLDGAAGELNQALTGMTQAQRDAALGTIFGNEQVTAATVLYKGGAKAVDEWTDGVNDAGFAIRQSRELMNNLAGDVEKLKGSLETAFISGGSGATEGLRDLTQSAEGAVNVFNGLPSSVQEGTVKVAIFTAGGLLATAGTLKMIGAVASARQSMTELGASALTTRGSLLRLTAAFGAVAVAGPLIAEGFDKIHDATSEAAPGIAETTSSLLAFAKAGQASGRVAEVFGKDLSGIKDTAGTMDGLTGKFIKLADLAPKLAVASPLRQLGKPFEEQREGLESVDQALADLVNSGFQEQAAEAFKRTGVSVKQANSQLPLYTDALAGVDLEAKKAADAQGQFTQGVTQAEQAVTDAKTAVDGLIEKVGNFSALILGQRGDAREYEAAIDAVTDSIKANGKSLDITTEKGRANQESLDGIARAGVAYAESTLRQTGSGEKFRDVLARTRTELIKNYLHFDNNKTRAEAYADSVLRIPSKAETKIVVTGLDAAQDKLDGVVRRIGIINGKVAVIKIRYDAPNVREGRIPSQLEADGDIVRYYGSGGMENHVAQIARPKNTVRVWAEPETGGEAYIPLAPSKRGRSTAILKQTAAMFGMSAFGEGGVTAGQTVWSSHRVAPGSSVSAAPSGGGRQFGSLLHADRIEVIRGGPEDVADEVMFRVRQLGG